MTWEQLWAFGIYDLRLREAQFWALTPREFSLLADRCEAQVRWHDLRAALAPWMMNRLWATKGGKVELEDLCVINMMDTVGAVAEEPPEAKAEKLQGRIQATFEALAQGLG